MRRLQSEPTAWLMVELGWSQAVGRVHGSGESIGPRSGPGNRPGFGAEPQERHGCRDRAERPASQARPVTVRWHVPCRRQRSEETGMDARVGGRVTPLLLQRVTWNVCPAGRACEPAGSGATEGGVTGLPTKEATSTLPRRSAAWGLLLRTSARRRAAKPRRRKPSGRLSPTGQKTPTPAAFGGGNRGGAGPPRETTTEVP